MKILDVVKRDEIPGRKKMTKAEFKALCKAAATLDIDESIELGEVGESMIYEIAKRLNKEFQFMDFKGVQRRRKKEFRTFILRIK